MKIWKFVKKIIEAEDSSNSISPEKIEEQDRKELFNQKLESFSSETSSQEETESTDETSGGVEEPSNNPEQSENNNNDQKEVLPQLESFSSETSSQEETGSTDETSSGVEEPSNNPEQSENNNNDQKEALPQLESFSSETSSQEETGSTDETSGGVEEPSNNPEQSENNNNDQKEALPKEILDNDEPIFDYQNLNEEDEIGEENNKKEKLIPHSERQEVEESEETPHELSEESNNFLNQLSELPSFENRERGTGYSIDTNSTTEIPESVVRTLITKFLNQRFCKKNSDLNVRSNSLEKSEGFYKWEVKDVIIHSKTHQLNKVLNDKYSYEYREGQGNNVPLSFYFDMSGSMSSYTNMLATIAIELLKKNVKVLIGFNERVNVQIDSIDKNITVEELSKIITSAGYSNWGYSTKHNFIKDSRVKFKYIDRNIDNYLFEKKAEKCVVFSDFDPLNEVINLSQKVQTYWFCFERNFNRSNLQVYNGFLYSVQNPEDILEGLVMVNGKRFETLCYVDNPKQLQKRRS